MQCEEDTKNEIFPPWSTDPVSFRALCNDCGECAAACGDRLIVTGENGLPVMNFSQGPCNFCGDCARTCTTGALSFSPNTPPWQLRVTIHQDCLTEKKVLCQLCQEQCEQGAIVFLREGPGEGPPRILSEKCNGCGACAARCPVQAIFLQYVDNQANQRGES